MQHYPIIVIGGGHAGVEAACVAARMGVRVYEVPISYAGRDYAEGKKIGFKDGVLAVLAIIRWRF